MFLKMFLNLSESRYKWLAYVNERKECLYVILGRLYVKIYPIPTPITENVDRDFNQSPYFICKCELNSIEKKEQRV
ncbi:hypothetical protein OIU76_010030 [Salix suchowensis]|nr:hypothetical protein OIU76_010030 [Salix suchowensis]